MNTTFAASPARVSTRHRVVFALVLTALFATAIRAPGLLRRLDQPQWRPIDTAAIARAFYEEGMNPLRPRIDWRGDGPGFTEMELPMQPFLMGLAYELTGPHVVIGRLLALGASLVAFALFVVIATRRLGMRGAMVASALFAVNPLAVELSTELQPEPFMLLGILGAVAAFDRYLAHGSRRYAVLASCALAFAILAKAPAAYLLLGFAFFVAIDMRLRGGVVRERGLMSRRALALLALACAPGVAWYTYAHQLWLRFGNSMGVSNESHSLGLALLRHPEVALSVLRASVAHAVGAGVLLLMAGALVVIVRERMPRQIAGVTRRVVSRNLEISWLAAALVYLVVIGRTAGDGWAIYYHIVAVPPAALLGGAAADALLSHTPRTRLERLVTAGVFVVLLVQIAAWGREAIADVRPRSPATLYRDARMLRSALPPGPIVVVGSECRDEWGGPVAYQAPYFFYWLERTGWPICREEVSYERVAGFAARGARVLVTERNELGSAESRVQDRLREIFPVLAETPRVTLFDITHVTNTGPGP